MAESVHLLTLILFVNVHHIGVGEYVTHVSYEEIT